MTFEELTKRQVDSLNADIGTLDDGFDCPICRNKGRVFKSEGIDIIATPCECMGRRIAIRNAKRSGADNLLKIHSFDQYTTSEKWQEDILKKAKEFAELDSGLWFIGGQVGSGKTMICISMLNRLLERGKKCKYFVWQNLVTELNKLQVTDNGAEFESKLEELAQLPVLYLDDFLREEPSKAEIKLAYRIINSRYMATLGGKQLITIISSQRLIAEIMQLDEAIGSRICEIGLQYVVGVKKTEAKNWRMKLAREKIKYNII